MEHFIKNQFHRIRELSIQLIILQNGLSKYQLAVVECSIENSTLGWPVSDHWKSKRFHGSFNIRVSPQDIVLLSNREESYHKCLLYNERLWLSFQDMIQDNDLSMKNRIKDHLVQQSLLIFEVEQEIIFLMESLPKKNIYATLVRQEKSIQNMIIQDFVPTDRWILSRCHVLKFLLKNKMAEKNRIQTLKNESTRKNLNEKNTQIPEKKIKEKTREKKRGRDELEREQQREWNDFLDSYCKKEEEEEEEKMTSTLKDTEWEEEPGDQEEKGENPVVVDDVFVWHSNNEEYFGDENTERLPNYFRLMEYEKKENELQIIRKNARLCQENNRILREKKMQKKNELNERYLMEKEEQYQAMYEYRVRVMKYICRKKEEHHILLKTNCVQHQFDEVWNIFKHAMISFDEFDSLLS
jgi:hypothetical protein